MSNSATVTPYAATPSSSIIAAGAAAALASGAVAAAAGAAVATAAIAEFLCDETEAERAAVEWLKSARRNNLLHSRKTSPNLLMDSGTLIAPSRVGAVGLPADAPRSLPRLQTVPLTIRESQHLLSAAAKLGYVEISKSNDCWLLRNKTGAKLALHAGRDGISVVQRAQNPRANVEALLVQHNLDLVAEHLQARGMSPSATRLTNGEIEIAAQESSRGDEDDRANITVRLKRNGELHLDVDRCVGNRCETIVQGLATAVGGKVASLDKKDAYFRPARKKPTRVRI